VTGRSAGPPARAGGHPGRPQSRSRWPVIAGVAVSAAAVALVLVVRDRDGGADDAAPPGPDATAFTTATAVTLSEPEQDEPTDIATETADPQQQAAALDEVLAASVTSRLKLNRAIQRIGSCTDVDEAVADMRDVGDERASQIQLVRQADLSALPDGEDLRSRLVDALTYALEADHAYLGWAEPAADGECGETTIRSQAYIMGGDASAQAGTAKRRFLELWNPVAADNGLSSRSAADI
jgi:hypothetical protein